MSKIYARQIPPEFQEPPLYWDMDSPEGTWLEGLIIDGNKHFKGIKTELYENIVNHFDEAFNEWEDFLNNPDTSWYDSLEDIVKDLFLTKSTEVNADAMQTIEKAFKKYREDYYSRDYLENYIVKILEALTGKKHERRMISGSCQSDWNYVIYPVDEWSDEAISKLEIEYFNEGSEWIIDEEGNFDEELENVEDIQGGSFYTHGWNENAIKQEIAEAFGCEAEEVVLYEAYETRSYSYTRK